MTSYTQEPTNPIAPADILTTPNTQPELHSSELRCDDKKTPPTNTRPKDTPSVTNNVFPVSVGGLL